MHCMQKIFQIIVAILIVDCKHHDNGSGILKLNLGLIAIMVLTSHVPNIKLDLAFAIVNFYIHHFLIVGGSSTWGFVSAEVSIHKLIDY